ncbi:MAG: FAD-dependent oxidoreductase, partial [Patescibacteria group bacterium]
TSGGKITAKKIVLAIGNPSSLFTELKDLVQPFITYVVTARFATAPIANDLYWDTLDPYFYYRLVDEHTLMVGGSDIAADQTDTQQPFEKIKQFITKHFPGDHEITNEWSGTIFHTADNLPYVFSHPHAGGKLFIATGYGGNGMIGSVLASLVLGELVFGEMHDASDLLSYRRTGASIPPLAKRGKAAAGVKQFASFGKTTEFTGKKLMICKVINDTKIVVFKIKDNYYAINNTCTHAGGSLCDGTLTDTAIQCPLHGAKFDVTTGAVAGPPAVRPVEKYAVRVKGDAIEVEVETDGAKSTTPPEPKKTYWKQLGIFTFFALLFGATQILFQYFSFSKNDLPNSFIRGCAFTGATLISLALFSSAIFKWFPKTADYWRFRRYCGVSGFSFIFGHVLGVLYLVKFDLSLIYFSLNPFQNPIIFGSIGFSIFLPMALTSTDWAVDKLTHKWWKRLHRLVYIAYLSAIFHFVSINPIALKTPPGYLLLGITTLALFGQLFWFFKTAKVAKFCSLGTLIGFLIITAAIITGYVVYTHYFLPTP